MAKNIFVEKKIKCPVCQTEFILKYPNPKMYAASGRDADQRVTGYTWTGGTKTDVVPHHYSVLQCPTCLLADFYTSFENPGNESKDRNFYKIFEEISFDQRLILRKLRRLVPETELGVDAAIALHLSAIFAARLPAEEAAIDHMKLARLYLRLSWLYKEKGGLGAAPGPGAPASNNDPSTTSVLFNAVEKMEDDMRALSEHLEQTAELARERARELDLPPDKNPYAPAITSLEEQIELTLMEVEKFQQVIARDKQQVLTIAAGTKPHDEASTGGAATLDEIMNELSSLWPQVPKAEQMAVNFAVEAFEYAHQHESANFSIIQSMGVANLILQLFMRIGNLEKVLEYSLKIYKNGFRDKQSLQMTLNEGKRTKSLKVTEAQEMQRTIGHITTTLTKSTESRKKILGLLYRRDKDKIHTLLRSKTSAAEQVQALASAEFPHELITWLKDNGQINDDVKKKKWFGK